MATPSFCRSARSANSAHRGLARLEAIATEFALLAAPPFSALP
jgi:hypothetical protein